MANTVSDEDLDKKREYVDGLRAKLADADADATEKVKNAENEIIATQLDAEAARLEAQISARKSANTAKATTAAASTPLDQAKQQLAEAQAQSDMTVGPVDTNADASKESTNKNGSDS